MLSGVVKFSIGDLSAWRW